MTVYVDVLLIENIAINFIILATTSYFSRIKVGIHKLLFGSTVGAAGVFIAFIPGFDFNLLFKIIFSFAIIAVTFWTYKIKEFFRLVAIFYLVSFSFGGAAFALFYFLKTDEMFYNGVFYINNFPIKTLIVSSVIAYITINLSWNFVRNKITRENLFTRIIVEIKEKSIRLNAFVDTGNSLKDPISNLPVVIVTYDAIKNILPQEICEIFNRKESDELEIFSQVIINSSWVERFRIIPFKSLGKENGILIGFKPDRFSICKGNEQRHLKDVIIGIYNKNLSSDNTYDALLAFELTN